MHLQNLPKGILYSNQYIFGLPAEIWGSHSIIQGSPGASCTNLTQAQT